MRLYRPSPAHTHLHCSLAGWFRSVLAIAAAVYYTIEGYTGGLLMLIAMLLAVILSVLATKERMR